MTVIVITTLVLVFILLLGYAATRFSAASGSLVERIDMQLPQTQCGQCDYPGCRPYAEALAAGEADINQCPPGGDAGIRALARLLGRKPIPLDTRHGEHKDRAVARIDESACIGCTLCIQACPVDAIIGAAKLMHTVLESECTGCELCLAPCPVDCIDMLPAAAAPASRWPFRRRRAERRRADLARRRYLARTHRLETERQERAERQAHKRANSPAHSGEDPRKAAIRAAIERTRAKKKAVAETAARRSTTTPQEKS